MNHIDLKHGWTFNLVILYVFIGRPTKAEYLVESMLDKIFAKWWIQKPLRQFEHWQEYLAKILHGHIHRVDELDLQCQLQYTSDVTLDICHWLENVTLCLRIMESIRPNSMWSLQDFIMKSSILKVVVIKSYVYIHWHFIWYESLIKHCHSKLCELANFYASENTWSV